MTLSSLRQKFGDSVGGVIKNTGISISEALEKIVEPFYENSDDPQVMRNLVSLAVTAWNLTIVPEADKPQLALEIQNNLDNLEPHERKEIMELFALLQQRKLELFPDIKNFIMDYQLTFSRGIPNLQVASAKLFD